MDWLQKICPRHLDVLVSLAKTQNLTRTAAELNMHQPGVSKLLRELEEDIGVSLFDRRSRGVVLNENGKIALAHAARIRSALISFREEMDVVAREGSSLVSIGFSGASSVDTLPSAILSLLDRHPNTHIRIIDGGAELLQARLIDFGIDLLVAQSGLVFDEAHEICEEVLWDDSICLCVRVGHPLTRQATVTWAEAVKYPLAVWAVGTPIRRALDQSLAQNGWSLPRIFLESNSASINVNLLVNSDMIGFSMVRGASAYSSFGVLSILPLDLGVKGIMSVYWRKNDESRKQIAAFLGRLRSQRI